MSLILCDLCELLFKCFLVFPVSLLARIQIDIAELAVLHGDFAQKATKDTKTDQELVFVTISGTFVSSATAFRHCSNYHGDESRSAFESFFDVPNSL